MTSLKILRGPAPEWDRLAESSEEVFTSSAWSAALAEGFSGNVRHAVLCENDRPVVAAGGVLLRIGPARVLYAQLPSGGLAGDRARAWELAGNIEEPLKRSGVDQIRLVDRRSRLDPLPFLAAGYKLLENPGHELDLSDLDEEQFWKKVSSSVRRNVKKAKRSGVTAEIASDPQSAADFHRLYLAAMERNEAAAKYPREVLEKILERFGPEGRAYIVFARREGRRTAAVAIVESEDSSHYFQGGSLTEELPHRPNDLAMAEAILHALGREKKRFDFMGSDSADEALRRYKAKWGAGEYEIVTLVRNLRPLRCAALDLARLALANPTVAGVTRRLRGG